MNPSSELPSPSASGADAQASGLPCVMSFNANDPSGAAGLAADVAAMASASCHVLPVLTAVLVGDTRGIQHASAIDDELVEDQARGVLEDIAVQAFKVGHAGSPGNLGAIARVLSDYDGVPVIAYMPDLSWIDGEELEDYLDACAGLLLPHATVLVGNHSTLSRWLLPDWDETRAPTPRELARAAAEHGTPYTLVTGINAADGMLESHLATPETLLASARYERFEASFSGAGETLSAALCALLAAGNDLQDACAEALTYLDHSLGAGFRPGMGRALPDRLFWAHESDEQAGPPSPGPAMPAGTSGEELLAGLSSDATPH
jgi:hydroxymethylpyrimidine/phosphomethylpyrimidine kinase